MAFRKIKTGADARQKIKEGVDIIADAVKITLGAGGRNVMFQTGAAAGFPPIVTKDGVTVARQILLEDEYQDMGAAVVREAAQRTNSIAGDGTTTATLLTQVIFNDGLKYITAGANPMELKKGIEEATRYVVERIKETAIPIEFGSEQLYQVACVSTNDDKEMARFVTDSMNKVGRNGVITVDISKNQNTEVDIVNGMKIPAGYINPYYINNPSNRTAILDNCAVIVADYLVTRPEDIIPIYERLGQMVQNGSLKTTNFLLIAKDCHGGAIETSLFNNKQGFYSVLVRSPWNDTDDTENLNDIAIFTQGKVISEKSGDLMKHISDVHIGFAEKVIVSQKETIIIGGGGTKEDKDKRKEEIQALIEKESDATEQGRRLRERLARMDGGIGVIYVGVTSELEAREKKDRYEDAINSVRSAMEEGVVAGGGTNYLVRAKELLNEFTGKSVSVGSEDFVTGIRIVYKALRSHISQLVINAGKSPEVIIDKVETEIMLRDYNNNMGYDIREERVVDMVRNGILDPAKVARVALENAASIASMLLTTEVCIMVKK